MLKKFIFNALKNRKERFPKLLSIELSSACNAKCIMCPHPTLMTRVKENMPFEVLEKIVQDCKNKPLKKINLFWFGDSFMKKDVVSDIRYIRKELPKVKLYISTNAGLLTPKKSREILDEGLLDVINFDIDGTTKETYEHVRKINFENVLKNVQYFLEYKKEVKAKVETRATIIDMDVTEKEVEDFKEFWTGKVDHVDVNKYNTWLGEIEDRNTDENKQKNDESKFNFACSHPWDELVISSKGIAGLCCLDYDLKEKVGDITKTSIQEVWQSNTMNEYRNKMINLDYDSIGACKDCNAHIFQKNKTWAKLQV